MFTAPSAGTYTITGAFLGIDTFQNSHPVEIMDDGTVIWSETISSFGERDSFSLSEPLRAGGIIAFFVGTGSIGCSFLRSRYRTHRNNHRGKPLDCARAGHPAVAGVGRARLGSHVAAQGFRPTSTSSGRNVFLN
jgi:hypothetical protein